MKIAVVGAGGVGGYFGGLLATGGHHVSFISRGEHLRALKEDGLQIKSPHGDIRVSNTISTNDPKEVGQVDYIIIAVKNYHLEDVARQLSPLIGPATTVVPLLNGVEAHEVLAKEIGRDKVVGGLCTIISMIESPGVIRQSSQIRKIVIGELDLSPAERVERIVKAWADVGVQASQSTNIFSEIWTKFTFIASFGGVTSLSRANAGEINKFEGTRKIFMEAMREVENVAVANGVKLEASAVESGVKVAQSLEPTSTSSMQRDVAEGRPFELEAFSGKIVRLGNELSIETPIHRAIYWLLLPALQKVFRNKMR
ncbi:MAG TPA: 2-dehydropantoate 2-reductase [Thermoguttaceae bacterium]